MNIVFVNYHDFTSNSAIHISRLADELVAAGDSCAVIVPRNAETVSLIGTPTFQALDARTATQPRGCVFPTELRRRSSTPGRRARTCAS